MRCIQCNVIITGNNPFCQNCGNKLRDGAISFYDYCINNNVNYYIHWSKNNKLNSKQVSYSSDKKFLFICDKNHEYEKSLTNAIKGSGCPYCCGSKILIGFNDLWTTHPEICRYLVDYNDGYIISKGTHCKTNWKCLVGHQYKQSVVNKISHNQGCPYCSGKKVLIGFNDMWTTNKDICEELLEKEDGYKYTQGSGKKVKWKCKKCNNIWVSKICNRTINKRGCPKCTKSKGEIKVEEILNKYNIHYYPQKRFDECRHKNELPFDFYLPLYNTCIEYQGEQHYIEYHNILHPKGTRYNKTDLEFTKYKDDIKKDFCQKNNIRLIEIPYWEYNNIESIIKEYINDRDY